MVRIAKYETKIEAVIAQVLFMALVFAMRAQVFAIVRARVGARGCVCKVFMLA